MEIVGNNEAETSNRKRRRTRECSNSRENREEEEDENSEEEEEGEDEDMIKGIIDSYYLHCSICMEPLRPSLMHCLNGHVSCANCWEKLGNKCPICTNVAIVRCIALEKLIESFKIPCKNKKMGCEESIPFYMKQAHLETCPFGPSPCPINTCTLKVHGGKLYKHFLKDHKFPKVDFPFNKPYTFHLTKSEDCVILLGPNKTPFILVTHPVERTGCKVSLYRVNPLPEDDETDDLALQLSAYTLAQKPTRRGENERVELQTTVGYFEEGEFVGSCLLVPDCPWSGRFEVSVLVRKQKNLNWI